MDKVDTKELICPHCGDTITFYIKPDGSAAVRFFDIDEHSDNLTIISGSRYEFGDYEGKEEEDNE